MEEKFVSVKQFAEQRGVSERTVRNYCAAGKIEGAVMVGKTWNIPASATMQPKRMAVVKVSPLLAALREQKAMKLKGSVYHRVQIDLTYNSNHIEGSRLTHEQTRYIFETNTIGITDEAVSVNDIQETVNHFRCIDQIIDAATDPLSESLIKDLHRTLKSGTLHSMKTWFAVGDYKQLPNEVGGMETCAPEDVSRQMKALLKQYNKKRKKTLDDIVDFHQRFEAIHPFQDSNGRVGRLIMFKECLARGIVPFIITEDLKMFYYRGLREWPRIKGFLLDTCLTAQDEFKALLHYHRIPF
ncbi:MAG: Fic family protein [Bacteroidales bacterium]|nr:Fic family protein [Bacteroidales bacterium]